MNKQFNIFTNTDKTVLLLYLLLVCIGWFSIFASEHTGGSILNLDTSYGKQLVWIITAFLIGASVLLLDIRFFTGFAWIIYALCIVLLIAVLMVGVEINATKAWFRFGGFAFQPSEIAKFGTALALASFMGKSKSKQAGLKQRLQVFAIMLVPAFLVLMQKDVGTTLVFFAFSLVLYREGYISGLVLFFGGLAILLFILTLMLNEFIIIGALATITFIIGLFIRKTPRLIPQIIGIFMLLAVYVYSVDYAFNQFLEPHHRARIEVLIGSGVDLQGAGYNLHQSKIAIGSGGLWGKGFLQGTQTQFNFVPEQSTDFIFCTIGEEWGFVGSTVIISLFILLFLRLVMMAERQKSAFGRVMGYSVVSILFTHFAINIGMTIGLVPVIGIPLPMISYGGSSLWGTTLLLFTFLKLDGKRLEVP